MAKEIAEKKPKKTETAGKAETAKPAKAATAKAKPAPAEAHAHGPHHKEEKKKSHMHASSAARDTQHCKIKGCKRAYRAKGYCHTHYTQWRHGKYGMGRYKICRTMDCRKPKGLNRHGFCEDHYQSVYVKGEKTAKPEAAAPPAPKEEKAAAAS